MSPDVILGLFYMCFLGAAIGTVSGLVPGIHVNTLATLLLMFGSSILSAISPFVPPGYCSIMMASCIMAAAVVHSAVDFVPSVFTGVPDADSVMNILPGHRLLLNGEGMVAVRSAAIGSLVGAFISLIVAVPMYYLLINGLGDYLDSITVGVLIFVLALMAVSETGWKKIVTLAIMAVAGELGIVSMNGTIPMVNLFEMEPEGMFPLLTGLFGIPALIMCPKSNNIPEQRDDERFPVGPVPGLKGVVTGSITGWFPGVTSTSGASIASVVFGQEDSRGFISMISSIGTASTMFTFVTFCVSQKERSGTMSVISGFLNGMTITPGDEIFAIIMATMAISSVLAYFIMIHSGHIMCTLTERIDVKKMNAAILMLMIVFSYAFTGYWGLILLLVSTAIGMLPILFETNRVCLTACLIIPVLAIRIGAF